ncbi:MAG TPA: RidA family protein [Candidatus Avanaerovorax faecigallinarum]|jgi:2-iminobutanoate/2-iminopropanoate deaminase|nr:RidA family protein [Candidatus Avanaerovorax faecigallinarum]
MKKTIMAKDAPAAVGPYVHAVQAGNLLYASGQLGLVPETGELPEGIVAQTKQSLDNVGAVLRAAGYDYKDVIKTTVFIDNMDDFGTVNEIYATYFTGETPARSCVEVAKLPKGALVEVEVVAYKE